MITYDQVPYEVRVFPQTHPDRLATMGRLFGLSPQPVTRCRVLELGCATGANLIPMAFHLPDSEFVGVDLSERQVRTARASIEGLGLRNIRIEGGPRRPPGSRERITLTLTMGRRFSG